MESHPQNYLENNIETNNDRLRESAQLISNMYIEAAENYLEEEDELRDRIVEYYSRPKTEQELINVLKKLDEEEVSAYIQAEKRFTSNPVRFIEGMEKLYEIQDVRRRRRDPSWQDRPASDEEYKLGVYLDVIESQVRSAVLAAQRKGYVTIQSGFREKILRDQFMDFQNRNIVISEVALQYLKDLSIEAKVEKFKDRTTLTLHPVGGEAIRLSQWKDIWDFVINSMPAADEDMVPDAKVNLEHAEFRSRQDNLRR